MMLATACAGCASATADELGGAAEPAARIDCVYLGSGGGPSVSNMMTVAGNTFKLRANAKAIGRLRRFERHRIRDNTVAVIGGPA
jgi:hypothetical protein